MSEFRLTETGAVQPMRRCLFGVTILLIEDSRAASEALRLFAMESGARLRRADSLASAHRHLAIYRPQVVVVDLGLPDGSGLDLIRALADAPAPFDAIVAMSGGEPGTWEAAARDAGATACLAKPVPGLRAFQDCILALLPDRGVEPARGADLAVDAEATVRAALEADLARALALLEGAAADDDRETIAYVAQFLASLGQPAVDAALSAAAEADDAAGTPEGAVALIAGLRRVAAGGLRGAA